MDARFSAPPDRTNVGLRLHVWGNSCSGKSTLAKNLSALLDLPFVELDALNWQPGWVSLQDTAPALLDVKVKDACAGDRWVVDGCYSRTSLRYVWPRVQTIIWLDLPRWLLVIRVIRRTWRRARSRELLWGSVRERFFHLFMLRHREDSLLWWIWTQHDRKRTELMSLTRDCRFAHIKFVRFTSASDADTWLDSLRTD